MTNLGMSTGMRRTSLLAFSVVASLALCDPSCSIGTPQPNLRCQNLFVPVAPGTCTEIQNPCREGGGWEVRPGSDSFEACPLPAGVYSRSTRLDGVTRKFICAEQGAPDPAKQAPIFFQYFSRARGVPDFGAALMTFTPLAVSASATPSRIAPGGASQLLAIVSGGLEPYQYSWTPADSLDDPAAEDPVASPLTTTTYTVRVSDASGQTRSAPVEVCVDDFQVLLVQPAATPATIEPGGASQLDANPSGGSGSYTYSWSPVLGLSDSSIRNPVASPAATMTYSAVVRDEVTGQVASGEATVVVVTAPAPTAFFTSLDTCCPPMVNLDASGSKGDIVSHTWDLSWTADDPDAVTSSPTIRFPVDEGSVGTITLTVTAADGRTASITRVYP